MAFLRRFHEHRICSAHRALDPNGIAEDLTRLLGSQRDYASFLPGFGLGELWHYRRGDFAFLGARWRRGGAAGDAVA